MTKHPLQGLYAITDSTLMPDTDNLLFQVEQALRGGARIIQYRDKSTDQTKRLQQALALVDLCNQYHRPLLINDDTELARACGAHGVHLGQSDGNISQAREYLGREAIIGSTCHSSLTLAQTACQQSADYVAFGAFFPSSTKPDATPAPITLLAEAGSTLPVPVVAIGGINMDNAGQVISAGADMIAVIHSLFACDDICARAGQFDSLFN
ncbi:thiamine phosphate synthase [Amphritea pacifica]|uniref:Thiamine-phosphate synthase n=1 Tax=Amphritea pacifica TaxID=2811233 RepID=A0ABS2WC08_9GAMM|nr:thiamine phosphate synthase [Amphritea pacifica]MBN0989229.1 thiamine phosphate synthase [Amphritea pacifica]MBN1008540.1 thiamine phosphate synthase [Amphritea pacifica]